MKIVVISSTIFQLPITGYGGLEHLAYVRAKGLAERGHQVTLMAPDGSTCPGVTLFHFGPAGRIRERDAYAKYWKELPKQDVIIDDSWEKNALNLKVEGKLKAPVLCVCHAPVNTMFSSILPMDKPCFVCISEDQGNHFRALFGRDCRVGYNGVDPTTYCPLNIPRSKRYLFLARFSTIKGPDLAIEACLQIGVGLDLIGDTSITNEPEYLQECTRRAEESSLGWDHSQGKQIRMIGPATRGNCVWWFSQAHALLHPNLRFREPMGLAPCEAMLCGCPVIAWNYGALRETVRHGETGFLVNSLDEMVNLIKTDAVASLDRNRCREWITNNFSEEIMIQRYESLCAEALASGGW